MKFPCPRVLATAGKGISSRLTSDRLYLEGLIAGSINLLGARVFSRLKPMFVRYREGTNMHFLLTRAVDAYLEKAVHSAHMVLATQAANEAIEAARRRAGM